MNTNELILTILRTTIWKTALEILDEIKELKFPDGTNFIEKSFQLSLGRIHRTLRKFEQEGVVSKRYRDLDEEKLKVRGGKLPPEYTLTQDGLRIKNDRLSKAENPSEAIPDTT